VVVTELLVGAAATVVGGVVFAGGRALWHRRPGARLPTACVELPPLSSWQLAMGTDPTALGQQDVLPTSLPDLRHWLMRRGAVDYGTTQVNLFVHGPQVGTGSVLDVRARVIRRRPPLTGSWLCSPMAGAVTAVLLMYDLDDDVSRGWEGRQDGAVSRVGESPYFDNHRHDSLVAVPMSHVPALALDELGHDHPALAGIHGYAPCLGETLGGSWTHPRCAAVGDTAPTHGGGGGVRRVSTSSVIVDHGHPPPVSPVSDTRRVQAIDHLATGR
jgi:hypothetical protein